MLLQAKQLKSLLKKHNIADIKGKLSVKTERIRRKGGYYEWGDAIAHVRELTQSEIDILVSENKYLSIFVLRDLDPKMGFSIIRSNGCKITQTSIAEIKGLENKFMGIDKNIGNKS